MKRSDSWVLAAGNLLPAVGVLLFAWNAASAVFLLWLGTLRVAGQFVASVLASRHLVVLDLPRDAVHPQAQRVGERIGAGIVAIAFFSPALGAGAGMYQLLEENFPAPLSAIFASPGIVLAILLELLFAAQMIRSTYRTGAYANLEQARLTGGARFVNLSNQCMVLMVLAWLTQWAGRPGLIAFLTLAGVFITWVETQEDWTASLLARVEAAGRARRARLGRDPGQQ